jgi:hypothetical protein
VLDTLAMLEVHEVHFFSMEEPGMSTHATAYPVEVAEELCHGFVPAYFGTIDLGHKSRNKCFARVAQQISRHPGGTLPDKMGDPASYHAMDRLMNRPETTHESILKPHCERTVAKMQACPGMVLILHDTTELDYSGKKALELGPIGNGHGTGYLCHNSLAVDPERREVFGLVGQILHQRVPVGRKEGVKAKRERKSRESRLWSQAVLKMPSTPPGKRWVDVADRGADLFEFLATEQSLRRQCVVRSTHNRSIRIGHGGQGAKKLLHSYLRTLPAVGERPREFFDRKLERERTAKLSVSYAALEIMPPHVRRGQYEKIPIRAWAVRVWEETPPKDGTQLEWYLLCLDPVTNVAEAWEKSTWYGCRWIEEEYHKAQKTGCQIEDMQFRTEEALQPMIALLSVVSVMLLNLRQAARRPDAKERKATEVVEPIYEEVLRGWRHKTRSEPLSVFEFYLALARMGGHMNRKADGFPGWLTLWRGWQKLQCMVAGVEIDRRRRRKFV